jgi:hypothetical protein
MLVSKVAANVCTARSRCQRDSPQFSFAVHGKAGQLENLQP